MAKYPDIFAGMRMTADVLDSMLPTSAYKTADTSVTNDVVVNADPHLSVAVEANAIYVLDGNIFVTSASLTPDFLFAFDVPTSATGRWSMVGPPAAATTDDTTIRTISTAMGTANTRSYGIPTAGTRSGFQVSGLVDTAGTAGDVTLFWAQNVSNATASTVEAFSWIRLQRIA